MRIDPPVSVPVARGTSRAATAAAEPPVPGDLLPDVIPALEKLEAALRSLEREIPPETLLWSGAEDEL